MYLNDFFNLEWLSFFSALVAHFFSGDWLTFLLTIATGFGIDFFTDLGT